VSTREKYGNNRRYSADATRIPSRGAVSGWLGGRFHVVYREALQWVIRSTGSFGKYFAILREADRWSPEQLQKAQMSLLRDMLRRAYVGVPYYRTLLDGQRVRPEDIRTADDLLCLPLMDKFTLRSEFQSLRSRFVPAVRAYTSGTSGTPVVILRGLDNIRFEHASLRTHDRWAGLTRPIRRFSLVGRRVVPLERRAPPFWKHDPFEQELAMSAHHLSAEHIDSYLEKLKRFRPDVLRAYPSTAHVLAHLLLERGVMLPLKAVFTQSEQLTVSQRRDIETAFQTRVYDRYGNAERVAAFFQCEHGSYHEAPLYSIVEYVPVGQGLYEVVGTTLHNSAMPLIRYRTDDLVELPANDSCPCGRTSRVIKSLSGRLKDQLVMEDGSLITVHTSSIVKGMTWLMESQILQESIESIVFRVVPMPGATVPDHGRIVDRLVKIIGGRRSTFRIEVMDRIPREHNGKLKAVKTLLRA
jgi:phenylacetate-CoA ligase